MNKSELIEALANKKAGQSRDSQDPRDQKMVSIVVNLFFDGIKEALADASSKTVDYFTFLGYYEVFSY